jgi:hypothetical protein
MGNIAISLKLPEELFNRIKAEEENMSEGIRDTLTRAYMTRAKETVEIDFGESKSGITRADFLFPVGDVICASTNPQTQLWWCPDERLLQLREKAKIWTENGFKFYVGKKGGGTWDLPDMIEEPEQERRVNGRFCVSCHGVGAKIGDRLVWLEIHDTAAALKFMEYHTDIPCAVRCDIHKYSTDVEYKEAFDRANELFIYYWENNRPKRLESKALSESDVAEMLDL